MRGRPQPTGPNGLILINIILKIRAREQASRKCSHHGIHLIHFLIAKNNLTGERQPLIVAPRFDVVVEEIAVNRSLHDPGGPHDPLAVQGLGEVAVDPVEKVQTTVPPEQEDIVASQGVDVLRPLQEHQLGQDRDGLQVNRESPQHLSDGELVVEQQRESQRRADEENVTERVLLLVIRLAHDLVEAHVPDDHARRADEDKLHCRVVNRDEVEEQI